MLKNKRQFYKSILLITALAITAPLYAPWYDSPRTAMLRLYQQAQYLFGQLTKQQLTKTNSTVKSRKDLDEPLRIILKEIESSATGSKGHWLIVKDLITHGADVNTITQENGNSALHLALSDPNQELIQRLDVIDFLTKYKANDRLPNKIGITPATLRQRLQQIKELAAQ